MAKRYFELVEGTSRKFWEVWVDGNEVYTRYGKIGTDGQTTIKDQGSLEGAAKLHDKLVKEKAGKGYAEKTAGGGAEKANAPTIKGQAQQAQRIGIIWSGTGTAWLQVAAMDRVRANRWEGIDAAPKKKDEWVHLDLGDSGCASVFVSHGSSARDLRILIVEGDDSVPSLLTPPPVGKRLRLRGQLDIESGTLVLCNMDASWNTPSSSSVAFSVPAGKYDVFADFTPVDFAPREANGETHVGSDVVARLAPAGVLEPVLRRAPAKPAQARSPRKIRTLDLSRKGLTTLPNHGDLTDLRELRLYDNPLRELPSWLWQLVNLEKLDLGHLAITHLAEDIAALVKLKHLSLCGTQLTMLPAAIWGLDLTELRLSHVPIAAVPSEISKVRRLALLWINGTKIEALPSELAALPRLRHLRVSAHLEGLEAFRKAKPNCLVQIDSAPIAPARDPDDPELEFGF